MGRSSMERSRSRRRSRSPRRYRSPESSRRRSRSASRSADRFSSRRKRSYSRSSSRGRSKSRRHSRDRHARHSSRSPDRGSSRRSRSREPKRSQRRSPSRSPSYSRSRRSPSGGRDRDRRRRSPSPPRRHGHRDERRGSSRDRHREHYREATHGKGTHEGGRAEEKHMEEKAAARVRESEEETKAEIPVKTTEPLGAAEHSPTLSDAQAGQSAALAPRALTGPHAVVEAPQNPTKAPVRRVEFQSPPVTSAESTPIATPSSRPAPRAPTPTAVLDPIIKRRREYREKTYGTYAKSAVARAAAEAKFEAVEANLKLAETWLSFVTKNAEDIGKRAELQDWRFKRMDDMDLEELLAPLSEADPEQEP